MKHFCLHYLNKTDFDKAINVVFIIAGVISHGVDYKKSAGGFIHGFRYTGKHVCVCHKVSIVASIARAVYRHFEWRYHGNPWPSVTLPVSDLLLYLVKRINEASVRTSVCVCV